MPTCPSCSAVFELLPGEAALHEKIVSTFETGPMDPPGDCPDCRLQRKMAWRNERQRFETTLDPKRPEKIYCDKCYLEAVY